ncbi:MULTISPECIES: RagB/SusD family nutrient uptake outer membrane protein [Butyricimonas]|uniref:RagB/SusD family nutrient uptake outer membrane protein n=1 Tax=Butyricimonas TaxID=574697 RepID=UPI0007FB2019|nr:MULTISPECIES: RagB/SusD family nutrient uptake outer membrane protein [Butyricimonas]
MKHIYYLFFFAFLLNCVACVDALDMTPENSVTFMNVFETERELEIGVMGAEASVRNEMAGQDLAPNGEYSDYFEEGAFALLQEHQPFAYIIDWGWFYRTISYANAPLPYIDKIDMPQERRDFYKGQIYFFKAFAYLHIVRLCGDCVLIRDEVETTPQGQTSWIKVIDYAIGLAKEAVRLLPEWDKLTDANGNAVTHRARPCKGAANALLAHLCAWKAGCKYMAKPEDRNYDEQELWKIAEQACTDIIKREDIYKLADTPEDMCESTLVGGSMESIFESIFRNYWDELAQTKWDQSMAYTSMARFYQGYPVVTGSTMGEIQYMRNRITNETVERMFPEDDLRRDAWFYRYEYMRDSVDSEITGGYAYPYKYRKAYVSTDGGAGGGYFINFDANKIWWRLADIILLRAECRARLGGSYLQGAIDDLNTIRIRAKAKLYDASEYGGNLRYAIFKEREKEFLIEGGRWFDVLRNEYYKTELYGGFRSVSVQDIVDGVFFGAITSSYFWDNPLLRQNVYWQRRM